MTIKAVLLKPLDGVPEGKVRTFTKADFETLVGLHAVRAATDDEIAAAEGSSGESPDAADRKSDTPPENKMEPAPNNKDVQAAASRRRTQGTN
ncbi:hypothetical protein [Sphingosinicella sp. BN140058]|uniref:hypothetical protein n=1 Tax=Sphingosinicella sp. BN140058 TaxID=1892855 RepID=UPI00101293CD|nr:hypothetical protein [Sphingosinicella sp. BN140058]QAY77917.1 hypothetical protein ETR14_16355 [Sphingosinicella sp. BN140058]